MKLRIPITFLLALGLLAGCQSKLTFEPTANFDATGQTLLSQGTFVGNAHPTSGTVKFYQKGGNRTLVFTDFRSDGGPDLRIYVAENTALRNFTEVTKLTQSGNFTVELPAEADPSRQKYVLIWCKAFAVLFGNAELK